MSLSRASSYGICAMASRSLSVRLVAGSLAADAFLLVMMVSFCRVCVSYSIG